MKNILFFCCNKSDYLSDTILIGLKNLKNLNVFEYNPNKIIYTSNYNFENEHGRGFTIGNIVDSTKQKVFEGQIEIENIDLFIFSNLNIQYTLFNKFKKYLKPINTLILDGQDSPSIFPYYGSLVSRPVVWKLIIILLKFNYYKREFIKEEIFFQKLNKFIPRFFYNHYLRNSQIRGISFSIPSSKIILKLPNKTKLFPQHIVDKEVLNSWSNGSLGYVFEDEEDYYKDLQSSKFGITTKKAGWDCMRHYEIAANGAVICFKNLHLKPITCAPHGLVPGLNCISYTSYSDLMKQISKIDDDKYLILQQNSLLWVSQNTCEMAAERMLSNRILRK